jgi:hypothetical protein
VGGRLAEGCSLKVVREGQGGHAGGEPLVVSLSTRPILCTRDTAVLTHRDDISTPNLAKLDNVQYL